MAEGPAYVVLGRGRWTKKMQPIIAAEGRTVAAIEETRQRWSENGPSYVSRLAEAMNASRAQIAWLCVSPGPHVSLMAQAALEAGLHVIVEKPWYGSAIDTERLQSLARTKRRVLAIHFEYLVHGEVEYWRKSFHPGAGLHFGCPDAFKKSGFPAKAKAGTGSSTAPSPDRWIPAKSNAGSAGGKNPPLNAW